MAEVEGESYMRLNKYSLTTIYKGDADVWVWESTLLAPLARNELDTKVSLG